MGKLRNVFRTQSVFEDMGKPENSMKFSEESSRTIHEMDNIELHELGQISRTVQCYSCLNHILEELTAKDQSQSPCFDSASSPCTTESLEEARNTVKLNGKEIIGKQWMPEEEHGNTIRTPL